MSHGLINTHKGLFQYNRLPFGVLRLPAFLSVTMENLLLNISYVYVRVNDILVSGTDGRDHLNNLEEVLKRRAEAGLRLQEK